MMLLAKYDDVTLRFVIVLCSFVDKINNMIVTTMKKTIRIDEHRNSRDWPGNEAGRTHYCPRRLRLNLMICRINTMIYRF